MPVTRMLLSLPLSIPLYFMETAPFARWMYARGDLILSVVVGSVG